MSALRIFELEHMAERGMFAAPRNDSVYRTCSTVGYNPLNGYFCLQARIFG